MFHMGSSFAHLRTIETSSPVNWREHEETLQDPHYKYFERVITVDKFWIRHYDSKLKCESEMWLQKGEWKHQKVLQTKLVGKVQLVLFFDCRWMIYQHICSLQQRINGKYYTTILKQMFVHICRKHPELVNNWILHQNNAPPHKACCITKFL